MKNSILICFAIILSSCSNIDDDITTDSGSNPIPDNAFTGYIVSNEGNFGTPNAELSLISEDLSSIENNLYSHVNNNPLGDVLQHISFYGNKAFIILNNSNKIEVINRYSFAHLYTITEELYQPRYSTIINQQLFVTNAITDKVNVYDVSSYELVNSVQIDEDIEHIISANDKVFVEKSYFGSGNSIAVYNASDLTYIEDITLDEGLNSIEVDNGNTSLFALSASDSGSKVYTISTTNHSIINEWDYDSLANASKLRIEQNRAYFISGGSVYVQDLENESINLDSIIEQDNLSWSSYYGFQVIDDKIFIMDAQSFTAPGTIKAFNSDGTFITEFTAGIGPNYIYKNY